MVMSAKEERYTKEQLLELANSKLKKLKAYCDELENQVDVLIKSTDPNDKKIRNSTMNLYNQQVAALISCTKMLIAIDKSSLENETENNEEKPKRKELVD